MTTAEPILTLDQFNETEFKEKSSLFIGQAYPVLTEEDAEGALAAVRKRYFDAAHHCYAFSLRSGVFRYSDAGEPSGTAGIRIYNAIEHFKITDLIVISIRYFGGTKLGVGPLGKAYYRSAYETLESAQSSYKHPYYRMFITAGFDMTSHIHRILNQNGAKITNQVYSSHIKFEILAPAGSAARIEAAVTEISKGESDIKIINETIYVQN